MILPRTRRAVAAFWHRAYSENITGLAAMLAYNMLLALIPFALVALFVGGRLLGSHDLEQGVLDDLRRIFPKAAESTLSTALSRVQEQSTGVGVAALVASLWLGSSFWGTMDTAFAAIFGVPGRPWLRQKRFGLIMLVVVIALLAATVAVPALQSIVVSGHRGLPFGLSRIGGAAYAITLAGGLLALFALLALIYSVVPNLDVPWRAIWPGAAAATVVIAAVDYTFPLYLSNISTLADIGTTLVFVVIVLVWFYALALIILGGATVIALRHERLEGAAGVE